MIIMLALLCGCLPNSGDGLLQPPRLSGEYLSLQTKLDALTAEGAVQALPAGGEERHAVSLVDVDGDGADEAISFFRDAPGASQFSVYLYRSVNGEYVEAGSVKGHAVGIDAVYYPCRRANGALAVVVCWDMGEESANIASVCVLEDGEFKEDSRFEYTDIYIDDAGNSPLSTIFTVSSTRVPGSYAAVLYTFRDGHAAAGKAASLSTGILGEASITRGSTSDGQTAFFVDSVSSVKGYVTDVLVPHGNELVNATLDITSGISSSTYRPVSVGCSVFGTDGSCLVPQAQIMPGYTEQSADAQWKLSWQSVSSDGTLSREFDTYYNRAEEWYFLWPDNWKDRVTVSRTAVRSGTETTFSEYIEGGESRPLFSIGVFESGDRIRHENDGYIRIGSNTDAEYYLRLPEKTKASARLVLTEEKIKDAFRVIVRTAGEGI